jgi:hypothetical protein
MTQQSAYLTGIEASPRFSCWRGMIGKGTGFTAWFLARRTYRVYFQWAKIALWGQGLGEGARPV